MILEIGQLADLIMADWRSAPIEKRFRILEIAERIYIAGWRKNTETSTQKFDRILRNSL